MRRLRTAEPLSQLGPRSRRILEMRLADGMKPKEIAAELGIKSTSVRVEVCRRLRQLRRGC